MVVDEVMDEKLDGVGGAGYGGNVYGLHFSVKRSEMASGALIHIDMKLPQLNKYKDKYT